MMFEPMLFKKHKGKEKGRTRFGGNVIMSENKKFRLTKGYSFIFQEEGHQIEAWFSALSGLEKIYVDGKLASVQRNLSTKSTQTFKIGGNEYSTNMQAVSLLKGPLICTLSKNGVATKRQKLIFPNARRYWHVCLICIGVVAACEIAKAFGLLLKGPVYAFIGVFLLAAFTYVLITDKRSKPFIEEEDVVK